MTRPRRSGRTALVLLTGTALSVAPACQCEKEKPYTPYTIPSALPPSTAAPDAGEDSAEAADAATSPSFAARPAEAAPPRAKQWKLGARTLQAPADRVFERGLQHDFDQDGTADVVAWLVRAEPDARVPAGELWWYPGQGDPKALAPLPGFVPSGPGCTLKTTLTQTGPQTVTLDARGECGGSMTARTATRGLSVVSPLAPSPVVLTLRLAEAGPGEKVEVAVDSSDRDADGRDDVNFTFTLQADGSERPATAPLGFFARPSGALREAGQPGNTLARRASTEVVRAKSKKSAASARDGVANLRRLMSFLCAEGAVPRLFDANGSPLRCGDLSTTADRLVEAEVQAALVQDDVREALAALGRGEWYFEKLSDAQRKALTRLIEKAVVKVTPEELPSPPVRAVTRGGQPRYSPLAFEESSALLMQTPHGLIRSVPGSEEPPALQDPAVTPAWPLEVRSPSGKRWTGEAHACDRSELLLTYSGMAAEPTRLLAARPGPCDRPTSVPSPPSAALGFTDRGLEAIVAGSLVGALTPASEAPLRPRVWGSPRSPDGRHLVAATGLGLLVTGGPRPELWTAPEGAQLAECAVSPGATLVACVDGTRIRVFRRPR